MKSIKDIIFLCEFSWSSRTHVTLIWSSSHSEFMKTNLIFFLNKKDSHQYYFVQEIASKRNSTYAYSVSLNLLFYKAISKKERNYVYMS